jgi:subtilisin family serine protease
MFLDGSLWGMNKIQAPEAWEITTGSHNVKIGIMDTGIANHPDLNDNICTELGRDFYFDRPHDTANLLDPHGTHVAGTVGAVGDNGIGVVGVNWNVLLVPMRIDFDGNSAGGCYHLGNK